MVAEFVVRHVVQQGGGGDDVGVGLRGFGQDFGGVGRYAGNVREIVPGGFALVVLPGAVV